MRVRVLKDFTVGGKAFNVGEVVEIVSPEVVDGLLNAGFVMQDKSLDGAKETKVEIPQGRITPPEPWPRKGKRRNIK